MEGQEQTGFFPSLSPLLLFLMDPSGGMTVPKIGCLVVALFRYKSVMLACVLLIDESHSQHIFYRHDLLGLFV